MGRPPQESARVTMPLSLAPGWVEEHPRRFEELLAARLEHPTPPEAWRAQWDACSRFLVDGVPPGPIDQPTWVVHGTLDRVVPVENAAAIKRRIPHATLTELPDAGHLCWLERVDEVNGLILDAL
jgi:3-oxoadipate enol-lactonase